MQLLHAIPALPVRTIEQSVMFYNDQLGFAIRHQDDGFAIVTRDQVELHLWEANDHSWQGRSDPAPVVSGAESFIAGTASCRIQVDAVDELHAELLSFNILHPNAQLGDRPWGTREFGVLDPDHNLITFFQRV